ncbi:unnamed protein product [Cuscuta epithymum]|uniref:Uncharacterized protein n=1 Tax=Cuscuta epithymum TaxID=186058 RepID=A0AAV0FKC8_9ASTE|nr:unnamed protein product [Cuscuta epithymum]
MQPAHRNVVGTWVAHVVYTYKSRTNALPCSHSFASARGNKKVNQNSKMEGMWSLLQKSYQNKTTWTIHQVVLGSLRRLREGPAFAHKDAMEYHMFPSSP